MKRKVALLIALAIALLSVSTVFGYLGYAESQKEKIYIRYEAMTIEGHTYSFSGWVTVDEDGSYMVPLFDESGKYSGICIYHKNKGDYFGRPINVDFESPPSPETYAGISAANGAAGAICLAVVGIKKKRAAGEKFLEEGRK